MTSRRGRGDSDNVIYEHTTCVFIKEKKDKKTAFLFSMSFHETHIVYHSTFIPELLGIYIRGGPYSVSHHICGNLSLSILSPSPGASSPSALMSASTIMRTSSLNLIRGSHPSSFIAFV